MRLSGQLQSSRRPHRGQHFRPTGHVGLHLFHILRRFERDPARVEGDRLPDEHDRAVVFFLGSVVLENNELRRLMAALRDAQ